MSLCATGVVSPQPTGRVKEFFHRAKQVTNTALDGENANYVGTTLGLAAIGASVTESAYPIPPAISRFFSSALASSSIGLLVKGAIDGRYKKPIADNPVQAPDVMLTNYVEQRVAV